MMPDAGHRNLSCLIAVHFMLNLFDILVQCLDDTKVATKIVQVYCTSRLQCCSIRSVLLKLKRVLLMQIPRGDAHEAERAVPG